MNIYAIHDRLIDYWLRPFAAPDDKEIMHSLSTQINKENANVNPIAQAPHHFDVYRIGSVTEDGHIKPERELICTCSSLVRTSSNAERGENQVLERQTGENGRINSSGGQPPAG